MVRASSWKRIQWKTVRRAEGWLELVNWYSVNAPTVLTNTCIQWESVTGTKFVEVQWWCGKQGKTRSVRGDGGTIAPGRRGEWRRVKAAVENPESSLGVEQRESRNHPRSSFQWTPDKRTKSGLEDSVESLNRALWLWVVRCCSMKRLAEGPSKAVYTGQEQTGDPDINGGGGVKRCHHVPISDILWGHWAQGELHLGLAGSSLYICLQYYTNFRHNTKLFHDLSSLHTHIGTFFYHPRLEDV